jgi:hypothetical protein
MELFLFVRYILALLPVVFFYHTSASPGKRYCEFKGVAFHGGIKCFLISLDLIMAQKHAKNEVFWLFLIFKILSRKPAANGAFQIIDTSRLLISWNHLVRVASLNVSCIRPYETRDSQ